jgi:Uncharacterised nucleotidyltransferase
VNYEQAWLNRVLCGHVDGWSFGDDGAGIQHVIEAAREEGIAALCFERVLGRDDLPEGFVARLRRFTRQQAALEIAREFELLRVLALFSDAGLHPLLIKGTALAYTLYSAPHLRSRCDTDLLFADQGSADRAWTLTERLGYRRGNAVEGEFISQEYAAYRTDALGMSHTLDIHWKPSNEVVFAGKLRFDELDRARWNMGQ